MLLRFPDFIILLCREIFCVPKRRTLKKEAEPSLVSSYLDKIDKKSV
jgi:hypothetical protein